MIRLPNFRFIMCVRDIFHKNGFHRQNLIHQHFGKPKFGNLIKIVEEAMRKIFVLSRHRTGSSKIKENCWLRNYVNQIFSNDQWRQWK